jgi:hypothetical protein
MNRSAGVSVSGILLILGGAFGLFAGPLAIAGVLSSSISDSLHFPRAFVVIGSGAIVLLATIGAWVLLSGVALLRCRNWARISAIVIGALLVLFCLPSALVTALESAITPDNGAAQIAPMLRMFSVIWNLTLGAMGLWWLFYFTRRTVKDQFRVYKDPNAPAVPVAAESEKNRVTLVSSALVQPQPDGKFLGRPESITIIAILMLVGAALATLGLLLMPYFWNMPIPFMGFILHGKIAVSLLWGFTAVAVVTGIGLLKLKPWARILAIVYFSFGLVNELATVLRPGAQAQYRDAMTNMIAQTMSRLQAPPASSVDLAATVRNTSLHSAWFGLVMGTILTAVQLWFVITRKYAFVRVGAPPNTN